MFFKQKSIYRHKDEKQFRELIQEAKNAFPNDTERQIRYFDGLEPKYQLLALTEITQQFLSKPRWDLTLTSDQLDFLYRSILDLANHMQQDLPDGVYTYNLGNLKGVTAYILEELTELKDVSMVKYFYTGTRNKDYIHNLSKLSETELKNFAADVLSRALRTIRSLSFSMKKGSRVNSANFLIGMISDDIENIPGQLVGNDMDSLKRELCNSMEFLEKLEPDEFRCDFSLEDYKRLLQDYPVLFK